ncbi:MAG: DUF3341 domain-containing protein [Bacteroidetes bacterium]|jgi:hypothetical protein|nr:DUF3341 domain-containing protein [Bacteroidota bacterium]MBT5529768.1 DUF3341 domain-containing protein [Cytophagia bacterium]MBT3424658.1 DUF3341 domain-containing protein [Bacteroidota bacterium]MBT3935271.1 DUF3341 domain-containing protein [Bacteroidota bacterium]MBT4339279.1 DUF3341 domain-containing protein [Bacteroidota bacterium]
MRQIVSNRKATLAIFRDEISLRDAVQILLDKKAEILEIRTPYEIEFEHLKQNKHANNFGRIAFWSGLVGFVISMASMLYLHLELPIQFAGKNSIPWPSFIIPVFLGSVLFAAIGVTLYFVLFSHVIPGQQIVDYKCESTDGEFLLIFKCDDSTTISSLSFEICEIDFYKQEIALPIPIKMDIK